MAPNDTATIPSITVTTAMSGKDELNIILHYGLKPGEVKCRPGAVAHPLIPALREAKVGGSLEVKSLRLA